MAKPSAVPAEEKARIVLSVLAGELAVAEAARRAKVSEPSAGNWKRAVPRGGPCRFDGRQVRVLDPGAAARSRDR
ncbi:transposase [Nocardia sp. NPDC005366]|uniref:transposase n=1 Tax=Nocardia sp. NPDC005366 TaxID=3156878 RepID=UPI0033AFDFA3